MSTNTLGVRRHDLDNLRSFLTGLVIIHHTSGTYGGTTEPAFQSALMSQAFGLEKIPLVYMNAYNQSFFMAAFFWLSGRNTAQSLNTIDAHPGKSRWSFVRTKLLRLGVPTVFYTLVLNPLVRLLAQQKWDRESVMSLLRTYYAETRGVRGPVWYTANLLILDLISAAVRPTYDPQAAEKKDKSTKQPKWYQIGNKYGWIIVAALSALIRIRYPISYSTPYIQLKLGHATQYLYIYIMGQASLQLEEIFTGPRFLSSIKSSKTRFITASLLSLATLPALFLPRMLSPSLRNTPLDPVGFFGGLNPEAFMHALWNEFSFALLLPAVMAYFRDCWNQPATSQVYRARNSYGAFLVHMFVSTVVEIGVEKCLLGWKDVLVEDRWWRMLAPGLMTGVVGLMNVFASFKTTEVLLRWFPSLGRII